MRGKAQRAHWESNYHQFSISTLNRPGAGMREAPKGLSIAGESSHRPFPASPPRMPQAPSQFPHIARLRPVSSPNYCPSVFFTELCMRGRKVGEGGKEPRGTPGSVVQAFHAAIFFRSGGGQRSSRDYDSQPPFRFVFVQKKKKTHTPPPHSSHTLTHTHTHGGHAHTRAPKGKPRLAFLPHR